MRQSRVIELDRQPPDPSQFQGIDAMLVGIYRDETTDILYVEIKMGFFDFQLRTPQRPNTREQAVGLARDFIREIHFAGRVQWQVGHEGPITDEPRL